MDREIVELTDVPPADLIKVLALLFEHLKLRLVRESTPDYVAYEVEADPKYIGT